VIAPGRSAGIAAAVESMRNAAESIGESWSQRLRADNLDVAHDMRIQELVTRLLPDASARLLSDSDAFLAGDEATEERVALIGRLQAQRGGGLPSLLASFARLADVLQESLPERDLRPDDRAMLAGRISRIPFQMAEIAVSAFLDAQRTRQPPLSSEELGKQSQLVSVEQLLSIKAPGEPVLERLRAGIAAGLHFGLIQPGDRLPSIRAVSTACGVDHRAVGDAYRRLENAGLVEVRRRQGAFVADLDSTTTPRLSETGVWLRDVLAGAAELRIRARQIPGLLERVVDRPLSCLCVEAVLDELVALTEVASGQWGMKATPFLCAPGFPSGSMADAASEADLILTTPFHAAEALRVGLAARKPVEVLSASRDFVAEVVAALRHGPLNVVVADPAYAERLRILPGAERMIVHVAEGEGRPALPADQVMLATSAARKALGNPRIRMLVAPSDFVTHEKSAALASVLVAHSMGSSSEDGESQPALPAAVPA
jgi:DNA-binding transcriptional regulator YhcF (GntR family)